MRLVLSRTPCLKYYISCCLLKLFDVITCTALTIIFYDYFSFVLWFLDTNYTYQRTFIMIQVLNSQFTEFNFLHKINRILSFSYNFSICIITAYSPYYRERPEIRVCRLNQANLLRSSETKRSLDNVYNRGSFSWKCYYGEHISCWHNAFNLACSAKITRRPNFIKGRVGLNMYQGIFVQRWNP
jgi:hypothetical protein